MEIYFSVVNTVFLVILFFYQRNRNKVLEDHLSEQRRLIDETKSVVTQQATALEGQGKVVETALKYSQAFDPTKIETIIRREVELDHKMKIDQLKQQFENQISDMETKAKQSFQEIFVAVLNTASSAASEAAINFIKPFLPHIIQSLILLPENERSEALASLPEPIRSNFNENIKKAEAQLHEILNKALTSRS